MGIASGPERILWMILIVVVVCYMLGAWLNRQRGKQLGYWLQAGSGRLGGRLTWKISRGTASGAQANISDAAAPFRQLQINYALLTREFPPLWAYEYLTGRRDLLAVRANLRSEPPGELEVLPRPGRLSKALDASAGETPWHWQDGPAGLGIAVRGPVSARELASVRRFLDRYGAQVQRISLRPASRGASGSPLRLNGAGPQSTEAARPHLMLFLGLSGLERAPAVQLFEAIRDVARTV
jgi:hypothetical protein